MNIWARPLDAITPLFSVKMHLGLSQFSRRGRAAERQDGIDNSRMRLKYDLSRCPYEQTRSGVRIAESQKGVRLLPHLHHHSSNNAKGRAPSGSLLESLHPSPLASPPFLPLFKSHQHPFLPLPPQVPFSPHPHIPPTLDCFSCSSSLLCPQLISTGNIHSFPLPSLSTLNC